MPPSRLPSHPPPPRDLPVRLLPLVASRGPWFRIHREGFGALWYGRGVSNRFDDPWRRFGVLYAAEHPAGAIVEVFGYLVKGQLVARSELSVRRLARLEAGRELQLVDITGPGLARLGADARLNAGDHGASRRWAAALHRHPCKPDGIRFLARHDPQQACVALFDRCSAHVTTVDLGALTDDACAPTVGGLFDVYGFGLDEHA